MSSETIGVFLTGFTSVVALGSVPISPKESLYTGLYFESLY